MDQLLGHSFIDAGAEGAVKVQFFLYAGRADILAKARLCQLPAAAVAERRVVLFYLRPALRADKIFYCIWSKLILAHHAGFRIHNVR